MAFILVISGNIVLAANLSDAFTNGDNYLGKAANVAGYNTSAQDPNSTIATIIQVALSFVGVIFMILMIYGGYLWMTARGSEEQVTKAKNLITAAVIGLIIVLAAYAITILLTGYLTGATLKDS